MLLQSVNDSPNIEYHTLGIGVQGASASQELVLLVRVEAVVSQVLLGDCKVCVQAIIDRVYRNPNDLPYLLLP